MSECCGWPRCKDKVIDHPFYAGEMKMSGSKTMPVPERLETMCHNEHASLPVELGQTSAAVEVCSKEAE
jgi:hypothetical protein